MKSWKTTTGGILALLGTCIAATWPEHAKIGSFLSSFGAGLGLLFARDNAVSDEHAGAGVTKPVVEPPAPVKP